MKKVIVVGGGLAGLITAYNLARKNVEVVLIEKKQYPFHRVCGEYISNETIPFLKSLDLFPAQFQPPSIDQLQLTSVSGREAFIALDLGGFGISRYAFDHFIYLKCVEVGVTCHLNTEVESIQYQNDHFEVKTKNDAWSAAVVIGSFGKRSKLDANLQRGFLKKRSPYVGVKYHIRTNHPAHRIALHNFKDGYCGISNVEDGMSTLCYLTHRSNVKRYGNLPEMERAVLHRNPYLKKIFTESEFLWDRPEVINEISFATKAPVENHLLMCGDAAGMITPLCGNGMAIAIHASKILSDCVTEFFYDRISRQEMETRYQQKWNHLFAKRLWAGRQIQQLFGSEWTSNLAVDIARYAKPLAHALVKSTHGQPF